VGRVSDEVAILRRPRTAYARLATSGTAASGAWLLLRRPLLATLLLGSVVSLLTTGMLTARLVCGGALVWSFVPAIQLASLAIVSTGARPKARFSRRADLFFAGTGAEWLFLLAFGLAAAFADPLAVYGWFGTAAEKAGLAAVAAPLAAWSAYGDFWFFRIVLEQRPASALVRLLAQRALSWGALALYFAGMASAPFLARALGR
jgi:hypothetical protein